MAFSLVPFYFSFYGPCTFTYYLRRCGCLTCSVTQDLLPKECELLPIMLFFFFFRSHHYNMSIHVPSGSKKYPQVRKDHLSAKHILSCPIMGNCPMSSHYPMLLTPAMLVITCLWSLGIKCPKSPDSR